MSVNDTETSRQVGTDLAHGRSWPVRAPVIHVTAPDGARHGPFDSRESAVEFGKWKWPDAICGFREEDPGCWEINVSTWDQPDVTTD